MIVSQSRSGWQGDVGAIKYFLPGVGAANTALNLGQRLLGSGSQSSKLIGNAGNIEKILGSGQKMLGPGQRMLGPGQRMLNQGQRMIEAPAGTQFTLFQPGGFVDAADPMYGNPDLYKFISGGIDQADIDYFNSKDVTDPYMAQDGIIAGQYPMTENESEFTEGAKAYQDAIFKRDNRNVIVTGKHL